MELTIKVSPPLCKCGDVARIVVEDWYRGPLAEVHNRTGIVTRVSYQGHFGLDDSGDNARTSGKWIYIIQYGDVEAFYHEDLFGVTLVKVS